jgi:hypothetical protein
MGEELRVDVAQGRFEEISETLDDDAEEGPSCSASAKLGFIQRTI